MKRLFLLSTAALALCGTAFAQGSFYKEIASGTVAAHVSPDGKYVVGYGLHAAQDDAADRSFLFNTESGEIQWLTERGGDDFSKRGSFMYVNNRGDIAGIGKDADYQIPTVDAETGAPTGRTGMYMPVIWKGGTERIQLPIGNYKLSDFVNPGNGLGAINISEDGKIVNGYIHNGTQYAKNVCRWVLNETSGEYDFEEMPVIRQAAYFNAESIKASADGRRVIGEAKLDGLLGFRAFLVYNDAQATVFDPYEIGGYQTAFIYDMSPSGKYALYEAFDQAGNLKFGIYDLDTNEISWELPIPETISTTYACTISDNEEGYVQCDGQLWYFSKPDNLFIRATAYFSSFEEAITGLPAMGGAIPYSMSADGRVIAGVFGDYSDASETGLVAWALSLPDETPVNLNAVSGLEVYYSSPEKVTGRWSPLTTTGDIEISQYRISLAGKSATLNVSDLTLGPDKKYFYETDGTPGVVVPFSVVAIANVGGKTYESAPSSVSCAMPDITDLYFYEDFDNANMDGNGNLYYAGDAWYPQETFADYVQMWHLDAGNYENNTPFFMMQSLCDGPWSVTLLSHWLDAREETEDFYFTYYLLKKMINAGDGYASKQNEYASDELFLEWSEDGFNWTPLRSYTSADYPKNYWNFFHVDLSELRGKVFQLRWRAVGSGEGYLRWHLDYMGVVKAQDVPAPVGLRKSTTNESGISLEWANAHGAYEFSYLHNHPVVAEQQLGNEGKPFQVGIVMDSRQSAPYIGMEVTTMTTLYYDGYDAQGYPRNPSFVEGIVYEDSEEVARIEFPPCETDPMLWGPVMAVLDKPIEIKAGKEYIFAVNLENDDPTIAPLWYQNRETFVEGKSDIYSEDGGKTWNWMSEFYADEQMHEMRGRAIWPIRVGIQAAGEQPTSQFIDNTLWGWNIFRNGERINQETVYFNTPHYTDASGTIDDEYTVQAYYTDGRVSAMSLPAVSSKVEELQGAEIDANVVVEGNSLRVEGNYTRLRLFTAAGVQIAATAGHPLSLRGLQAGVYLLQMENEISEVSARKIAIR